MRCSGCGRAAPIRFRPWHDSRVTHRVSSHLGIDLADYDDRIRTFIPDYDELLDAASGALTLVDVRAPAIVDLGIGTGALAERCLRVRPGARLVGIDADPEMLAAAGGRLERLAADVTLVDGSFERVALSRADAFVASLSLHHVPTRSRKVRLYRRVFAALKRGGLFVSADCAPAADGAVATRQMAIWRDHMERTYDRRATNKYFKAWSGEDVYTPLAIELALMAEAGFRAEVLWRRGPFAVVAARRR
jgi:SAM-dependent methyltransferase